MKSVMCLRSRCSACRAFPLSAAVGITQVLARFALPRRADAPAGDGDQRGLVAQPVEDFDQQRVPAAGVERAVEQPVGQAGLRAVGGRPAGADLGQDLARRPKSAPRSTARRTASGSRSARRSYTAYALSASMTRTAAPLYVLIVTKPEPARIRSATHTGVFDTPSRAPASVSTSVSPSRTPRSRSFLDRVAHEIRARDGPQRPPAKVLATDMSDLIYDATYNIIMGKEQPCRVAAASDSDERCWW